MPGRFSAVVPAAGLSSRMKRFKPLLPLGDTTIVGRVIRLFLEAGIDDVRVVVGHRRDELRPVVQALGATVLVNPDYRNGMFSSVAAGVASLGPETTAFFVLPVDIPLVRSRTITRLAEAGLRQPDKIVRPCFDGKSGHPPLIPGRYIDEIADWSGDGGLKAVLEKHGSERIDVEVPDENILLDMDTPRDYEQLLDRLNRYGVPSRRAAEIVLAQTLQRETRLYAHSKAAAELAVRLAEEIGRTGLRLDMDLVFAAALLHDLAKGKPNHAKAGERLLKEMEYTPVAEIVAAHLDLALTEEEPVSEAEIVFLADKLLLGDRIVSLEERFKQGLDRYGRDPEAKRAIEGRWKTAQKIRGRIEAVTGRLPFLP
ncbi:MAG: NTP transferase domain-containing protein [Proteobacteria bacterium]|nr:NTP transferase domain-containing protein [Pseudomonadota bacterium]